MHNRKADVASRGNCIGKGGIWELSVPSAQYCCKPKNALKAKTIKNRYSRIENFERLLCPSK